jgi:DNA-binding CsgD family transcriptional regulator
LVEVGPHPAQVYESWYERSEAWLAHVEHHVEKARTMMVAACEAALRRGEIATAVQAAHDLVTLGDAETAAGILDELVGPQAGPLYELFAAHAHAAADEDPAALADVANRFAEMAAHLWASQSAAAAAAAYSKAGDRRAASHMALFAEQHAAQCEVPSAASNLVVRTGNVPLTRREREVAQLAAAGFSSREIGERTFLSVRTVDNHLGRVYDKLHVRNRSELAEVLAAS